MPNVTLITDFGNKDFYAGALKGTILKECGPVNIVDISHEVEPFNITEAAFLLKNAYPSFPQKTVHVVCVNDLDDRHERFVIVEHQGQYFVGIDNGIFSLVFQTEPTRLWALYNANQNGSYTTFPGKDILVKTVKHILLENALEEIASPINELKNRTGLLPVVQDTLIRGTVIYVDSFQNVIVNITRQLFEEMKVEKHSFMISFKRNERVEKIAQSYHDVPEGEKLCLFNSNGYLEIAINSGKASSLLGLNVGDVVQIDFQ